MPEAQAEQVVSEHPGVLNGTEANPPKPLRPGQLLLLSVTVLGVVFGDIGTSPLYAFRMCFEGKTGVPATPENVLGILSLIFWALVIVISVKYVLYVMRAQNEGEGGILALMALVEPKGESRRVKRWIVTTLGVFGAALLYGDGMITPAISVLSAVEGVEVRAPSLQEYVAPVTILILVLLFLFQKRGTAGLGSVFGPVMVLWFVTLAALGINSIARQPQALLAVNPVYAFRFMLSNGWMAFIALGFVFLVVTGGEALYADMGHFGSAPIRFTWFALALPALLLNYFGQGALVLRDPQAVEHPFYGLVPLWAVYPLVGLATLATVIASQAVITAAFSLTRQAALLGHLPRLRIVHTSRAQIGQIYVAAVNWTLMVATIWLVLTFRQSGNLAGAYGVAVSTTMIITTVLVFFVAREKWGWPLPAGLLLTAAFLLVDIPFWVANLFKISQGGWFPLLVGVVVFTMMTTWKRGHKLVRERLKGDSKPLKKFLEEIGDVPRLPGTTVYLTGLTEDTPAILLHQLRHNHTLHERVVLLNVAIEDSAHVRADKRIEVVKLTRGFYRVFLHCGFMETPDVPAMLRQAGRHGLDVDFDDITYYVGHRTVVPSDRPFGMLLWREKLYDLMERYAADPVAYYRLPSERVLEIGIRVEL